MINSIKFIKNLLDNFNIEYWMDFGCLLHMYRDNEFSKDDVDFGLMIENYDRLKKILEENKHYFEMIHYRDKEISIRLNNIKFDFIFFKKKDNNIYFYAYKQNLYCSNKWNYEWRGKFPYEVYFPLGKITLQGLTFNAPNNIEKKIEMQYGSDWKTPKPHIACWTYELNQVKDESYKPIAVLMTTFLRDDIMKKVIPSYLQYPVKLYLLDQGNQTQEKEIFYNELRKQGHYIAYSNFDVGLSHARNILLDQIKDEEYILLTEDDIELTTNPYSLLQEFSNNNLGILGGMLKYENNKEQHYEYELELKNNKLYYKKSNNIDIVLNFYLAKRRVFEDIRYDNELKLVEHTDFALRLKQLNKWKVGYSKKLTGIHHKVRNEEYSKYRYDTVKYIEKFNQKWNIEEIIKEDKSLNDLSDKLTVFLLTCGENINYQKCLDALNNQSIKFNLNIIKNYHPMGIAFQEMLNRCETEYYCQIDDDMILNENAIETMYNSIINSDEKTAMVCYKLHDVHLNKGIDGVKIYKYNIFKNYPYNINVLSCEMEQLENIEKNGFNYKRISTIIGQHCPIWTKENIFERYYNYIDKLKKFGSKNYINMLNNLLKIFLKEPNQLNLYAFIGGLASILTSGTRSEEKDFTKPILKEFKKIDETFANFKSANDITIVDVEEKIPILQISSIPCAGRPYEISAFINKYSKKYNSRCILGGQYCNTNIDIPYREFPYDLLLSKDLEECKRIINNTKIIHIHHNIDKKLLKLITKDHKIVFTVSNLNQSLKINNDDFNKSYDIKIRKLANIITTTNEPLQIDTFSYLTDKHLPLIKNLFDSNINKNNECPVIVFAPTNRTREGVASKGYNEVLGIIYKLFLNGYKFSFDLIEGVPYLENLNRKKMSDILIDDIMSPTFHNSSIEGACFGSVVLTNYSDNNFPFLKTDINNLETNLKALLTDKKYLEEEQKKILEWKNDYYKPDILLKPYENIYDSVLNIENKIFIENIEKINVEISDSEKIQKFITELSNSNINYCFAKTTCKEIVINGNIINLPLYISTNSSINKLNIESIAKNNNIACEISINRYSTKKIKLYNIDICVPYPVKKYLETTFKKSWKELNE